MRRIAVSMLCGVLGLGLSMLKAQQTSTTQTSPTQNKDIPRQEPGTNNPDLGQQRHDSSKPGSTEKHSHHRRQQSSKTGGNTKPTS
jgi:hypothetical protein